MCYRLQKPDGRRSSNQGRERETAPRSGGEEGTIEPINMGADVPGVLKERGSIPKAGDGVASATPVGDRLEVSRIHVTLQDPTLSAPDTPIGLLINASP